MMPKSNPMQPATSPVIVSCKRGFETPKRNTNAIAIKLPMTRARNITPSRCLLASMNRKRRLSQMFASD